MPLYLPNEVDKVISFESTSFIGCLNNRAVLKYPCVVEEQWERFVIEERMYKALRSHPCIITCFGLDGRGLKLEYALNKTLRDFLCSFNSSGFDSLKDRLRWSRQAAEAIAYIHMKNIIHCNISIWNFLLNRDINMKLFDFQGLYIDSHGVTFNSFLN